MAILDSFIPNGTKVPTADFYTQGNASNINFLHTVVRQFSFQEMTAKSGLAPMTAPNVTNLEYSLEISKPTVIND